MRGPRTKLAAVTLGLSAFFAGCGSIYDDFYKPLEGSGAAGSGGGAGASGSAGAGAVAGASGSAGATTTGGASGAATTGGTGGAGPVCGDGKVEGPEQCDDLNTGSGDGCDASCAVEPGYSCTGQPSACQKTCGNGMTDAGEDCDDGNAIEGDGCFNCKLDCGCGGCTVGVPCAACPAGGDITFKDPTSKHCYRYVAASLTWDAAEMNCVQWGGHLAALSTPEEMNAISVPSIAPIMADLAQRCWIGGTDVALEGTYVWVNGETWMPPGAGGPPWAPNNPSNSNLQNCLDAAGDHLLRDRECSLPFTSLCERTF